MASDVLGAQMALNSGGADWAGARRVSLSEVASTDARLPSVISARASLLLAGENMLISDSLQVTSHRF